MTGARPRKPYTLKTCPDRGKHTPSPDDYLRWHEWAEEKAKTYVQETCPTCGLYAIWKPKTRGAARPHSHNAASEPGEAA